MAKAAKQNNGKAISKRATGLDAKDKYLEYGYLARKTSEQLIAVIIGDITAMGTSDSNGVLLIEAAGFYLGKLGVGPDKIWQSLKELEKTSNQNILKGSLNDTLENEETGLSPLFIAANGIGLGESYSAEQKPTTTPTATPSKPGIAQPQADRGSCLESAAKKLMDAGYLPITFQYNTTRPWTPEFDKGFRDYIEAASAGKAPLATNPALTWAEVAKIVGQTPDLSGACNAINSTELTAPIKTPETPAAATGTPEATTPVAPTKEDILPKILSVMSNTRIQDTPGFDMVKEPRRAMVLVQAAGGTAQAAKLLYDNTDGLLEALSKVELTGPIPVKGEWPRRNKAILVMVVNAINALIKKVFGPVMNLRTEKAVEKLREFIAQSAEQKKAGAIKAQWTKLASQRKDRIRSEIAEEMTAADRITARRIRARESV